MPPPEPMGLPLVFPGLLAIVGGGRAEPSLLRDLAAAGAALVGADGGANAITDAGCIPDAVIGDFDSVRAPEHWPERTRLVRISEQETTDFEKALYSTRAPVTVALGMTGGRFDHTLAALDAVARHAAERRIILVDETDVAVALDGPFDFTVGPGERVSVHPLGSVRFEHSEGLQYPLDGLLLAPGLRTGTSNAAVEGRFRIVPAKDQAPWLLILAKANLMALISAGGRTD